MPHPAWLSDFWPRDRYKAPGWSQRRATQACGWETNSPFCGWLLGQRLRGEIRYPLLIDSAWNTTDKMFLKFSWASRGHAGRPAPLSPHTGSLVLFASKNPAWACVTSIGYHSAKSSIRTPWAWARTSVQTHLYPTQPWISPVPLMPMATSQDP